MKSFSFSLEAVLTVRSREENAAAEAWAQAMYAEGVVKQRLAEAHRALEVAEADLGRGRAGTFQPGGQAMTLRAIENQRHTCERIAKELETAARETQTRHEELIRARMRREVLTRLKEKKMNEYGRMIQAMEEIAIDDLIIVRHGRGRTAV